MTMEHPRPARGRLRVGTLRAALVLALAMAAQSGEAAGVMDWLFGRKNESDTVRGDENDRQRLWQIHEFSALRLVPEEKGAVPNQQPVKVSKEGLRQALETIQTPVKGRSEPLFGPDELGDLIGPITEAFAIARPGDDLLLLSTTRAGGFVGPATSITARLFVVDGNLNLIVDSTRQEFVDRYRGTKVLPDLTYGTRSAASSARIESALGTSKRPDWLLLPMGTMPAPAPVPLAAPATPAQRLPIAAGATPAAAPASGAAAVPAPVAVPAPAAPAAPRGQSFYDEQEQRLTTLKRLHDKGLISDQEYEQKRREVLQGL